MVQQGVAAGNQGRQDQPLAPRRPAVPNRRRGPDGGFLLLPLLLQVLLRRKNKGEDNESSGEELPDA